MLLKTKVHLICTIKIHKLLCYLKALLICAIKISGDIMEGVELAVKRNEKKLDKVYDTKIN